jgi:hypothetical protein
MKAKRKQLAIWVQDSFIHAEMHSKCDLVCFGFWLEIRKVPTSLSFSASNGVDGSGPWSASLLVDIVIYMVVLGLIVGTNESRLLVRLSCDSQRDTLVHQVLLCNGL